MGTIWGKEPVAIVTVIQAGLALAVGFGLHLTTEQMSLILTFTGLLLGLLARSQVTPTPPKV